jgi:hypothetical protein
LTNQTAATVEHYLNIFKDMKYEDLEDMKSRQEALNTSSDDETGSSSLSSSDEEKNESDEEDDGEVLPYELPLEEEVQAVFENF